jgi:hypothetical protein
VSQRLLFAGNYHGSYSAIIILLLTREPMALFQLNACGRGASIDAAVRLENCCLCVALRRQALVGRTGAVTPT